MSQIYAFPKDEFTNACNQHELTMSSDRFPS